MVPSALALGQCKIKPCDIRLAALEAVKCWKGKEGQLSKRLQISDIPIDEDFLGCWLIHWMVARNIRIGARADLADYLDKCVRSKVLNAPETVLPDMVEFISRNISEKGWTVNKGRPTSLVSKFAFSLRPMDVSPYDSRARRALEKCYNFRLRAHDYKAYWSAFRRFAQDIENCLEREKGNMTEGYRKELERNMPDKLFKLRTADKALMLIGGFQFQISGEDYCAWEGAFVAGRQ